MEKTVHAHGSRFTSFFCHLFGHRYVVSKRVTNHIKEYRCIHCQQQVTTDVSGHLSRLTPQLRDINNTLQDIYSRRKRRQTTMQKVA